MKHLLIFLLAALSACSDQPAQEPQIVQRPVQSNSANANVDYGRGSRNYEELLRKQADGRPDTEVAKRSTVPPAFKKINFENFDYPAMGSNRTIRLRNGKYEFESTHHCEFHEYEFGSVEYGDFTDDGRPEALVYMSDLGGCGSSGVASLFYLYTSSKGKPTLIWSFETGFQAQCGFQNSVIKDAKLVIEVIGNCTPRHKYLSNEDSAADIEAYHVTNFVFGWKNSKFRQVSREVIPLP